MSATADEMISIGKVIGVNPARRELRVEPSLRRSGDFAHMEWVRLEMNEQGSMRCRVDSVRDGGQSFIVKLGAGTTRDSVAGMKNARLLAIGLLGWAAFLVLFPRWDPSAQWNYKLDRGLALQKAKQAASSLGHPVTEGRFGIQADHRAREQYFLLKYPDSPAAPFASPVVTSVRIDPGDWIVGDETGVLAVPQSILHEVLEHAEEIEQREQKSREELAAGISAAEVFERYQRM